MKIKKVYDLKIKDIKIIQFGKFSDNRGYFMEHFRKNDFDKLDFMNNFKIVQSNESYSKKGVFRGLHFQWEPYMGKLVRVISGCMYDMALDIRIGSPTYGKIVMHKLTAYPESDSIEWIWVPPGFAHGAYFLEDTTIEYYCTGQYSNGKEASISPFAKDIDWSFVNVNDRKLFDEEIKLSELITDKDRNGYSLDKWNKTPNSLLFIYSPKSYNYLVTGGSGLLGKSLKKYLLEGAFPTSAEFNIIDYDQMDKYLSDLNIKVLVHCAALASPPGVDKDPILGMELNIIGTANLVKLCKKYNIKLVYISTDYVFDGKTGEYKEDDPVNPVNKYAWTKLGGECAVRMLDEYLIIRTTFGPDNFPYPKAFIDQWTSRESVSKISKMISVLLNNNLTGIFHVGGKRKTVYEYANNLRKNIDNPKIGCIRREEVSVTVPYDTSLNCDKYNKSIIF